MARKALKRSFYKGSERPVPADSKARAETVASRGFYPLPRSFKGLKSQKAP